MDEEWQTAAFGSRHMHNRVQNRSSRNNRPFDVHKAFGSYTCKCPAWRKRFHSGDDEEDITLQLYRLSSDGEGVLGEIHFPHALDATVVLSGSRASLNRTIKEIEVDLKDEDGTEKEIEETAETGEQDSNESDAEDSGNERGFEKEPARLRNFEKNSFREPKFWIRWQGEVDGSKAVASDLGYVVFSGNECRKFKGTITCGALGWKDVAISGCKISSRGSSDVPVHWNGQTL